MPVSTTPTTKRAAPAGRPFSRASQSAQRRADLAAIHAAAHALGMDHSDQNPHCEYRSLLLKMGGHLSAADMSAEQREAVKKHLQGLQRRAGQGTDGTPRKPMTQAEFTLLLWKQLGEAGALQDPSQAGLRAFLEKHGQASHPRLMGPSQGRKVIEALKAWLARSKKGGAA